MFKKLPETLKELWSSTMSTLEEAMDTGIVIAKVAAQEIAEVEAPESIRIIIEVPKSP